MKYKETSQKELKINERFNKLIILKEDFNEKYKIRHWICKCDCGNVISLSNTDLLIYNKKSVYPQKEYTPTHFTSKLS